MAATLTDIFIIALLTGAIAYGYYVSRKMQVLMAALKEIEPLVNEFSQAVDKSEESVVAMKETLDEERTAAFDPVIEQEEEAPSFATRRQGAKPRMAGVQVVRDKQDLVRRFFDASRSESRV